MLSTPAGRTEYKRIMTSSLLNTARFSHSRLRFEQQPVGPSMPELAFVTGQDLIGTMAVTGLTTLGGGTTNPSTNNAFYWTFSDDLTWTRGAHLLTELSLARPLWCGTCTP